MSGVLTPGSSLWLLRHELRLAWRGLRGKAAARGPWVRLGVLAVLIGGGGGWVGWRVAGAVARRPTPLTPLVCIGFEVAMGYLLTLMLAQALTFATQAFYERNDLDLLLSSPLPPRRIVTVRGLGIATASAALYLLLLSAVLIPLALRGAWWWLSAYAVVLDLALLATALGLLLAMTLFRTLGARRTRVVSQLLGALIGASAFLLVQARNLLPHDQWTRLTERFSRFHGEGYDPRALYAWPARAVSGDPLPLVILTGLCVGVFLTVAAAVGRRFASDAAAAAGVGHRGEAEGRRRAAGADRARFTRSPLTALARKDARLLLRDPWLISQMALQLLYLLPLAFVIWRSAGPNLAAAAAAPVVFFAGQLAGNLTWVVVSAEDAPELIVAAPVSGARVLQAKLLVALGPVAVLMAVPVALVARASPLGGVVTLCCGAASGATAALINVWYAKPADRKRMMRRRTQSGLMGVAETLLILAWAAAAFLLLTYPTRMYGAGLAAAAVVGLALLRRPTVYRPALA